MSLSSDEFDRLERLRYRPIATWPDWLKAWRNEANYLRRHGLRRAAGVRMGAGRTCRAEGYWLRPLFCLCDGPWRGEGTTTRSGSNGRDGGFGQPRGELICCDVTGGELEGFEGRGLLCGGEPEAVRLEEESGSQ